MRKVTFKHGIGLIGIAGLVYAGAFFVFFRSQNSGTTAIAAAQCLLPPDSQTQDQVYFVGCGGFF